jgi:hypothetical protein
MKQKPLAYILNDKARFVIATDTSGHFKIFLEVDYHKKCASIYTDKFTGNGLDFVKEFIFVNTDPRNMQVIGKLIEAAGKAGRDKLDNNKDEYEAIV